MRSTFSILYYINRGKVKADWTTAIMCRITIDGKSSVFTTGYYCNPECWNTKNGTVKDGRTNGLLANLRARLETSYMNQSWMLRSSKDITHGCSQTDIAARQRLSNAPRR